MQPNGMLVPAIQGNVGQIGVHFANAQQMHAMAVNRV